MSDTGTASAGMIVAGTERPGGLDVLLLPKREHLATHDTGHRGPAEDTDDDDDDGQARVADRHQGDGEQQKRDRQHDVDHPGDHGVDQLAEVAGCQPEHRADDDLEQGGHHPDDQRDSGTVGDPHQDVPTLVVGAQEEVAAGGDG